jgi:membrane AbrB-like protein
MPLLQILAAGAVGLAGASIFVSVGAPLPWMLGPMFATALLTIGGFPFRMPRAARTFARPVIGVLAGSTFTPDLVASVVGWWPAFLVVALFAVVSTLAGYLFFRHICRFDRATSFFAATPAGLNEMSLLGDQLGGDLRALVLIHATRIVAVVSIVPVIVRATAPTDAHPLIPQQSVGELQDWVILIGCGVSGYFLGRRLPVPGGPMLASLFLSAVIHLAQLTDAAPPHWLVSGVQLIIGCIAGARFAGIKRGEAVTIALGGIGWGILIVGATFLAAYTASALIGLPFTSLLLALAPGGMVEMTLVAYALGIEVAFVIACQVLRNVFTVMALPYIYQALHRERQAG